jgi:hypothetical protein
MVLSGQADPGRLPVRLASAELKITGLRRIQTGTGAFKYAGAEIDTEKKADSFSRFSQTGQKNAT